MKTIINNIKQRFNHLPKDEVTKEIQIPTREQGSTLLITECLQNLEQIKTDFQRNKVSIRSIRKKDAAILAQTINKLESLFKTGE
ncbi:MAG: hypothetical protein QY331_10525 [Melioribacteraceae bacterium]|nr:MAG: hypothetical protein QY331_10525 [Melioribacteraceae bacterium]